MLSGSNASITSIKKYLESAFHVPESMQITQILVTWDKYGTSEPAQPQKRIIWQAGFQSLFVFLANVFVWCTT